MMMAMTLALLGGSSPTPGHVPTLRQLICRGQAHLEITAKQDPSPRSPRQVSVTLSYRRSTRTIGDNHLDLEPGHCTWNPYGQENVPPEPGVVEFDIDRVGSAAVPDPRSLAAYLGDPAHFWVFYVDDVTNVAVSHGAYRARFWVGEDVRDAGRTAATASLRREELRCRGGGGLAFHRGGNAGPNQVAMTLEYAAAGDAAGFDSQGLAPGTCAWVDRTGARAEPGRIEFVTAGNAQLRQIQSGGTVDRSITAAERFPDANTIPRYMMRPGHYWSFTVKLSDPDSALGHAAWKRSVAGAFSADRASGTTQVQTVFDIRNVQVTPGLEGAVIRFEAAGDVMPTVAVNVAAPAGSAPELAFRQSIPLVVSRTSAGAMAGYTAASSTPLARGTRYWYVITAPAGANARLNQATGDFQTLAQHITIGITEITIISDGDSDSNGDLWFGTGTCPTFHLPNIAGSRTELLDWTEGRHPLTVQLKPLIGPDPGEMQIRSVPDRFRLVIVGYDNDDDHFLDGGDAGPWARFSCERNPDVQPGRESIGEWNSIAIDFDLTKHPGTKGTESFLRRSKPLRNGSTLAFEVRGYLTVERK